MWFVRQGYRCLFEEEGKRRSVSRLSFSPTTDGMKYGVSPLAQHHSFESLNKFSLMGRNAQEIQEARDFLARNGVDGSKMAIKDLRSEEARITQELAEEKAKRTKEAKKGEGR